MHACIHVRFADIGYSIGCNTYMCKTVMYVRLPAIGYGLGYNTDAYNTCQLCGRMWYWMQYMCV